MVIEFQSSNQTKLFRGIGKKIVIYLGMPAAILMVVVIRIIRPLVFVRFGYFTVDRIGHFAANTEIYLCEKSHTNFNQKNRDDLKYFEDVLKKNPNYELGVGEIQKVNDRIVLEDTVVMKEEFIKIEGWMLDKDRNQLDSLFVIIDDIPFLKYDDVVYMDSKEYSVNETRNNNSKWIQNEIDLNKKWILNDASLKLQLQTKFIPQEQINILQYPDEPSILEKHLIDSLLPLKKLFKVKINDDKKLIKVEKSLLTDDGKRYYLYRSAIKSVIINVAYPFQLGYIKDTLNCSNEKILVAIYFHNSGFFLEIHSLLFSTLSCIYFL